jgi:hypothetical protein
MSTANAISSALYAKLAGSTTVTNLLAGTASVYRTKGPENCARPFVVYSLYAGGPLNINPSDMRDMVYFVRAYVSAGDTAGAVAGSIDAACSALLHGGTLTVNGYTCYKVQRELDQELVETPADGEEVHMCGGLYRISLDA